MDANCSPWSGRRVLVTGSTSPLGAALTRELLESGAVVVGLVQDRTEGSAFARERDAGQLRLLHGRNDDSARLHSAMAVNEVSAVFHLSRGGSRGEAAVTKAVGLYHSKVPVVVVRSMGQLQLVRDDDVGRRLLGVARFDELFGGAELEPTGIVGRTIAGLLDNGAIPFGENRVRDFVHVHDAARACLSLAVTVGTQQSGCDVVYRTGWQFTEQQMVNLVDTVFRGGEPEQFGCPITDTPSLPPSRSLVSALHETIAMHRQIRRSQSPRTRWSGDSRRAA